MIRDFVTRHAVLPVTTVLLLLLLSFVGRGCTAQETAKIEPIPDGSTAKVVLTGDDAYTQQILFAPTSTITISVTNIPKNSSFFILQVHTYQYNISLSYDKMQLNSISNKTVFGSNVGLFVKVDSKTTAELYLKNDNVHVVQALLAIVLYSETAPVPGGCNMEFDIEIAPYQRLLFAGPTITVDFQPASVPLTGVQRSCNNQPVQHETYRMHLGHHDFTPESYFTAIKNMLTVKDIVAHGTKIPPSNFISSMRRVYSAYYGVGSVYATVALYEDQFSAYIPTFSYACSPILFPETCKNLSNTFAIVLSIIVFLLGVILLKCKFVMMETMTSIYLTGAVIGYIIAVGMDIGNISTNLGISLGAGAFMVLIWHFTGLNTRQMDHVILSILFGLFFACIAYYHLPVISILSNDWIFWILFATIALGISVGIMALVNCGHALTCAIFHASLIILPLDYFNESSLKYIVINVIRRVTVSGFNVAVIDPPAPDVLLITLWVFIPILRAFKQHFLISCCKPSISLRRSETETGYIEV